MEPVIITIDGPSGAGKSTVSRKLASVLGYTYIDSGALYRIVALAVVEQHAKQDDDQALARICDTLEVLFASRNGKVTILSQGKDISELIRTPAISMLASKLSAKRITRDSLTALQRRMGKKGNTVLEGRDAGTVVFPEAPVKFYLSASPEERGRRRYEELREKGFPVTLEQVTQEVRARDHNDSTRNYAPLCAAPDAVIIDSTAMTIEAVMEKMMQVIKSKIAGGTV